MSQLVSREYDNFFLRSYDTLIVDIESDGTAIKSDDVIPFEDIREPINDILLAQCSK